MIFLFKDFFKFKNKMKKEAQKFQSPFLSTHLNYKVVQVPLIFLFYFEIINFKLFYLF